MSTTTAGAWEREKYLWLRFARLPTLGYANDSAAVDRSKLSLNEEVFPARLGCANDRAPKSSPPPYCKRITKISTF